jgi:tripartite-type tricarboxylate transporter receptor subunit TctC
MPFARRSLPGLALALSTPALAQSWPSRPIRVIVPYAASGGTDLLARALAEALRPHLPQPWVVENRAGAAGVVGSEAVARAEPDGHTLLCVVSTHVVNRYHIAQMPYDPIRDFSPVAMLTRNTMMLVSNVAAPWQDLRGMIAYAKANPGKVGSGSTEALSSFIGQELGRRAGVEIPDVAYRSGGQLMNDIVAGHLPSGWTSTASVMPHMQTGRVRVLAASTAQRSAFFPEAPTVQEQGVADFDLSGWVALLAPKGLPPAIADRMNALMVQAFRDDAFKTRLTAMGIEPDLRPAPALAEAMQREDRIWAAAAAAGHIKAQ